MKEALKLAYDYIDEVDYGPYDSKPVLAAIKAALAQTAAQAERQPLTDEEIEAIWRQAITQDNGRNAHLSNQPFVHIARAIEATHGIKEST